MKVYFIFFVCITSLLLNCSSPAHKKEHSGLFPIKQNGKCGYIDKTGTIVITPQFDSCNEFSEDLAAITIGDTISGKMGFIDTAGKIVINPQFGIMEPDKYKFSEGLSVVNIGVKINPTQLDKSETGKFGYIDKNGKFVINPQFNYAEPFSDGLARVDDAFIDKSGKTVIQQSGFYFRGSFQEELAEVELRKNSDGNVNLGFVDKLGNVVFQKEVNSFENFSEGLAVFSTKSNNPIKCGYVNKTGNEVITAQFDGCEKFSEGLAAVNINGKYGFIDTNGKMIINPQFDYSVNEFNVFSEGLACVRVADKYGYIDRNGKFIVNPQFDGCRPFDEGLAKVDIGKIGLDQKSGYIDKTGKYIWNPSN